MRLWRNIPTTIRYAPIVWYRAPIRCFRGVIIYTLDLLSMCAPNPEGLFTRKAGLDRQIENLPCQGRSDTDTKQCPKLPSMGLT